MLRSTPAKRIRARYIEAYPYGRKDLSQRISQVKVHVRTRVGSSWAISWLPVSLESVLLGDQLALLDWVENSEAEYSGVFLITKKHPPDSATFLNSISQRYKTSFMLHLLIRN